MNRFRAVAAAASLVATLWLSGPGAQAASNIDVPSPSIQNWSVSVLQVAEPANVAITTQADGFGASEFLVSFQMPGGNVNGGAQASPALGVIYNLFTWDTAVDGVIGNIDISMDLRGVESSYISLLAGRVRPAVLQGGVVYGHATSVVDIYIGDTAPVAWSIPANDQWWRNSDSQPGFDPGASGPIQFGFIWNLSTTCAADDGCITVTALSNFVYDVTPVAAVPEPASWAMLLVGLGLVARRVVQRRT